MIKDITLGQYFPGNSVIHKTDARIKIVVLLLYMVAVLAAKSTVAFLCVLFLTICFLLLSRISLKILFKGVKPLIFILIFTAVINLFFTTGEHILFSWRFVTVYKEGALNAAMMALRLIALIMGTSVLLSYTTSPLDLTDGLERLLSPLKRLHVPVHEFSMMMTIALRFIPTLIEETDKIISAQKARGVSFNTGNIFARIKALVPILIPLFYSALRRAYDLAEAMECRLYHGGEGRTRMKVLHLHAGDFVFLGLMAVFCAGVFWLNRYEIIHF